jgi:hypothetical protein
MGMVIRSLNEGTCIIYECDIIRTMLIGELRHCGYVQTIKIETRDPASNVRRGIQFALRLKLYSTNTKTSYAERRACLWPVHVKLNNWVPVTHDQSLVYEVDRVPYP